VVTGELSHSIGEVSEIVFFLLGAMTIVEVVDAHQGFKIITDVITTRSKVREGAGLHGLAAGAGVKPGDAA